MAGQKADEVTDYDRACAVEGYLGVIDVAGDDAIVLGDEPMQTTWIDRNVVQGSIIARWFYGLDEDTFFRLARLVPDHLFAGTTIRETCEIELAGGEYLMFDSAIAGVDLNPPDFLALNLLQGRYRIDTIQHDPNAETRMIVHRLLLI